MSRPGIRLQFSVEGTVVATATLDANDTATDFVALLPLALRLEDYASTEKIAVLPRPLATVAPIAACTPVAGDIAFYVPWGNIAIFYNDGQLSQGLVRLGRLDAGWGAFRRAGRMAVVIALAPA